MKGKFQFINRSAIMNFYSFLILVSFILSLYLAVKIYYEDQKAWPTAVFHWPVYPLPQPPLSNLWVSMWNPLIKTSQTGKTIFIPIFGGIFGDRFRPNQPFNHHPT